jgi:hypothetical protein
MDHPTNKQPGELTVEKELDRGLRVLAKIIAQHYVGFHSLLTEEKKIEESTELPPNSNENIS